MPQDTQTSLITVTDDTFDLVLRSELPVVLDFWADWCPPCRAIERSLHDLADEFTGRLLIAKINSDENPIASRNYRVLSLPTLLYFKQGQVVGSQVGARPKAVLRDTFAALL